MFVLEVYLDALFIYWGVYRPKLKSSWENKQKWGPWLLV